MPQAGAMIGPLSGARIKMSGGWGCPHDNKGQCEKVEGRPCDPGMKGCVLFGRFTFSDTAKNRPANPRRNRKKTP